VAMQGYGDRGGAGHEEAWQLWGKAGLTDSFPQAWALADVDRDNRLNAQVGHGLETPACTFGSRERVSCRAASAQRSSLSSMLPSLT
jgi:hypothetical protein